MGRLALRAAWGWPEFRFTHINELEGDAATAAHLLTFDSIHGRWSKEPRADGAQLEIDGTRVGYSGHSKPGDVSWRDLGAEIVLECTGNLRTPEALSPYFEQGVRKVIVAAPVKEGALNAVVGVNDHLYDPDRHDVLTAASCTTNCLAPVVKVIHEGIGIEHGSITTLHDLTNTQTVVDAPHKDLRRARASSLSLIPTTHRFGDGDRPHLPRAGGQARRPRRSRPPAQRVADRLRLRGLSPDHHRGGQRPPRGRRRRPPRRHSRLRGAPAGLGRLPGRPPLGDRRRSLDDGHRSDPGQGSGLVRQ